MLSKYKKKKDVENSSEILKDESTLLDFLNLQND